MLIEGRSSEGGVGNTIQPVACISSGAASKDLSFNARDICHTAQLWRNMAETVDDLRQCWGSEQHKRTCLLIIKWPDFDYRGLIGFSIVIDLLVTLSGL